MVSQQMITKFPLNYYKRVFTFGCSFTQHIVPTWADLLFTEMSQAECYNFGKAGSGNLLISNRIAQANLKYKFTEFDLIVVLYTTPLREDRFIDGQWISIGNIFNQEYYDKNFVKKYCDVAGLLLRDAGILEISSHYVKSLPCDSVQMIASDISGDTGVMSITAKENQDILKIYKNFKETFAAFSTVKLMDFFPNDNSRTFPVYDDSINDFRLDGHPDPLIYYELLQKTGFPLTEKSKNYAEEATARVNSKLKYEELLHFFPEVENRRKYTESNLF